jgi:2-polyprenyl-3-methyl-5-hydroxy-6-metoxy-1,4-benzoquinol methylase
VTDHFDEKAATWDDDPTRAARAADVARQIMERVPLTDGMDVLDFGSGTGLLGFQLLPHVASVTFADPSEGMLQQVAAKLRAGGFQGGHTLRLAPGTPTLPQHYDAIVSLMTLHHVADPTAVLASLAEHLRPGGWLAVCDLDAEDGSFHDDDPHLDVHHGFERHELTAQLEALGLESVHVSTAFVMRRERATGTQSYPLFLLTGQRPGRR